MSALRKMNAAISAANKSKKIENKKKWRKNQFNRQQFQRSNRLNKKGERCEIGQLLYSKEAAVHFSQFA